MLNEYGVFESNPLTDGDKALREEIDRSRPDTELGDPQLAKITRLRLLSDPGFPFWDVSYCYGRLKDGTAVRVNLPVRQFRKYETNKHILEMCIEAGVYGKGLGIFDEAVQSKLC